MNEIPLYNSTVTKNYIEFIRNRYPDVDIDSILDLAGMTLSQVEDGGHWFTQSQVDLFQEKLTQKTGNPNIAREAGRYIAHSKAGSIAAQYSLGFITPASAYKMSARVSRHFSRGFEIDIESAGGNEITIVSKAKPGVVEKPYQCQNQIGMFESFGMLFTGKYASVSHPECVHQGGKRCKYIISWEKTRALFWKQIRNYIAFFALLICLLSPFLLSAKYWIMPDFAMLLLVMVISLYSKPCRKRN